jgi:hypothetical protein
VGPEEKMVVSLPIASGFRTDNSREVVWTHPMASKNRMAGYSFESGALTAL